MIPTFRLRSQAFTPKTRAAIAIGILLSLYGGASAIAALGDKQFDATTAGKPVAMALELPALEQEAARIAPAAEQSYLVEDRMRQGDSIATLFQRLSLDDDAAVSFIKSDATARRLFQVRPGRTVNAQVDGDGHLQWLRFANPVRSDIAAGAGSSDQQVVLIERVDGKLRATQSTVRADTRVEMHNGVIDTSLFAATDAAGVPDSVTSQIADLFGSDIDFHTDLRRGDSFRVIFETLYVNGEYLRSGRVLAAEFVNAGRTLRAAWFETSAGHGGYYGADGKNLRRAFLRSPLEFSRVSSGFTSARMHPIMQQWRKHEGVDFAASMGTPIRASGDGVVSFVGWKNGYGNTVVIQHRGRFETLYGHMSQTASGLRAGMRVDQGQVIGAVGMTGWATGPHLHYEFHVDGKPTDPLRVALPDAEPISPSMRAAFNERFSDMDHRFALMRTVKFVAQR
ncbi:peptidoglycan DD-metalloendopeptidase family protein [soil metagenome]